MKRDDRFWLLIASALGWGGLVVPVSTTLILIFKSVTPLDFERMLPWVFAFTALPAALLSTFGAVYLGAVGMTCGSTLRLALHSLLVGSILSLPYSVLGLVNSHGTDGLLEFVAVITFAGSANGLAYALVFRRLLFPSRVEAN